MTLGIVMLLAALGAGCTAWGWRRRGQALCALSAAWFLAVGCGVVPAWLLQDLQGAHGMQPAHAWGQRNAIVVLASGMERIAGTARAEPGLAAHARLVEAAALQRVCRATGAQCKILLIGGDSARTGTAEAAVHRRALLALGLNGDEVLIEPYSTSTWQHARFAGDVLQHFCADHVALVSSGVHLRRSQLYFSHFGVRATQVRADYLCAHRSLLPRPHNFVLADAALHEYLGIARYHLRVALGELPVARGGPPVG